MRIRTRLLVLILSVLIPSFLASLLAVWFVYKEQQQEQINGMSETARALSALVDSDLQATESLLRALASSPAIAGNDLRAFYDHARSLAPPETSTVVIRDLSGKQLLNTRLPFGAPLPKGNSNLSELQRRYGLEKTVVSDLFFAPAGKRYDYAVQVPIMQGGEVRHHLAMGIAASNLQSLLNGQGLPAGWLTVLVDRQGMVMARTSEPERYVGKLANEALRKRILAGEKSGLHYGTTLDGRQTAAFFSRAAKSEWTVVVNIPVAEMRRPAIYAAQFLGGIMLVLLGVAIAGARWYARRTAEPIEQLRMAAKSLGRGEPVRVMPSGMLETDAAGFAMVDASRQIRQHQANLELRVAEAVAAAERAQRALLQGQKLEALGRLTGGIAHDFNNILQTLATSLQLIRLNKDASRIPSLVDTCERAIERAALLTGQMRSFGRAQEARLDTIRPDDTLHAALPLLQSALPSSIRLDLRLDDGLWPVTVDTLQFELALLNVVINARDAMPDGGGITLDMRNVVMAESVNGLAPGNYVRIAITDTGTGMSAEVLSRALDPFFTTKPVDKGSGWGLSQTYAFATQARGTALLHSEEGKGTTVTLYLPQATGALQATRSGEKAGQPLAGSGTLLLVEDDALVRESMAPALSNAGFRVVAAADGEQALAMLDSEPSISMVLSDIVMPGGVSGIDLARIVRERFPHIRVVLATGYTETRVDMPHVGLLAKPYRLSDAVRILSESA
ncbi:hybrid sensor histidine kinase/response regulator [Noviherbaspirillum aerium]|uniref:hybrid sensor histidine kinase/response regulator n=1 Tax=Noviherbaspirillum aerium TaxID=2588497 RepID=UPI00124C11A3|nr:ATP-binding protein [Noviherbaspirillum aerium]